jgi:hypothetical protein
MAGLGRWSMKAPCRMPDPGFIITQFSNNACPYILVCSRKFPFF